MQRGLDGALKLPRSKGQQAPWSAGMVRARFVRGLDVDRSGDRETPAAGSALISLESGAILAAFVHMHRKDIPRAIL